MQELEKKIDELEKTISQLQQAAVVKEDAAEKSGAEKEYRGAVRLKRPPSPSARIHKKPQHAVAVTWVLKAAKPGVAWVAKKGSDDLHYGGNGRFP